MWIKKLYATFGKLDNKTLELSPGLNIVYGRNESGKSTWSAFIRAMFYGVSTREKEKAGFLPDKTKFLPWSGNAMYGKMELEKGGNAITIERISSPRTSVFAKENATYDASGLPCDTGEALVGAARGVYERCAFIGQSKIGIDHDADTEKRILSIASSGDESVSASDVRLRLEKRRNEIRSPRGLGSLPQLERELISLRERFDECSAIEEELTRLSESLANTLDEEKKLSRALKIAQAEEDAKKRGYISAAKEDLAKKREQAKAVEKYPTREVYDSFTAKKDEWRTLSHDAERRASELEILERELSGNDARRSSGPFSGMSEELARENAKKDSARLAGCSKKKLSPLGIILIVLSLFTLVPLIFMRTVPVLIFVAMAFIILLAAGIVTLLLSGKGERQRILGELSEKYGAATDDAICHALEEYLDAVEDMRAAQGELSSLRIAAETAKKTSDLRKKDLSDILIAYGVQDCDITAGESKLRELILLRERAFSALSEAEIRVEAIEKTTEAQEDVIEYTPDEIPTASLSELSTRAEELSARKKSYELRAATLRERLSGFSHEEESAKIDELTKQQEQLIFRYDALTLAIAKINEADAELKSRFSPEVEKRASEIFKFLTGGSFEIVRIKNGDFDMDVAKGEATAPRDRLMLSQGTLDELWFSLRLALCELILSGEDAPPMVLDDVFVNFDDERMARALELLKELSGKRQVILFSCHTREAEFFEKDSLVNKISL